MLESMNGSGTEEDPYQITDVKELRAVGEDLSACYELVSNIDAKKNILQRTFGKGFNPIGDSITPFTGILDGNNFKIRNLYIDRTKQYNVGLFGVSRGEIKNVCLVDSTVSGMRKTGGLIGCNEGVVSFSSHSSGDISGDCYVGGVVGHNENLGTVKSSYAVEVDVSGFKNVGGSIGYNFGVIESSYATEADISGDKAIGGLIGSNYGKVESSFVLSELDEDSVLEDADLIIQKENHRISYVVESNTLYIHINGKTYCQESVSPTQVQTLVYGSEVEMTDRFRGSVVSATE